eukprot:TRINITY_DN2100_c0_g1_i1.p1 TRINITY_DN2100_c0_g1~~TRINITY_DN2100_c0_g1_i1.p1  ORF type:complete len:871 (+),score=158.24 TRINITY_DN2100_c0_g1_i1:93-2615(+)
MAASAGAGAGVRYSWDKICSGSTISLNSQASPHGADASPRPQSRGHFGGGGASGGGAAVGAWGAGGSDRGLQMHGYGLFSSLGKGAQPPPPVGGHWCSASSSSAAGARAIRRQSSSRSAAASPSTAAPVTLGGASGAAVASSAVTAATPGATAAVSGGTSATAAQAPARARSGSPTFVGSSSTWASTYFAPRAEAAGMREAPGTSKRHFAFAATPASSSDFGAAAGRGADAGRKRFASREVSPSAVQRRLTQDSDCTEVEVMLPSRRAPQAPEYAQRARSTSSVVAEALGSSPRQASVASTAASLGEAPQRRTTSPTALRLPRDVREEAEMMRWHSTRRFDGEPGTIKGCDREMIETVVHQARSFSQPALRPFPPPAEQDLREREAMLAHFSLSRRTENLVRARLDDPTARWGDLRDATDALHCRSRSSSVNNSVRGAAAAAVAAASAPASAFLAHERADAATRRRRQGRSPSPPPSASVPTGSLLSEHQREQDEVLVRTLNDCAHVQASQAQQSPQIGLHVGGQPRGACLSRMSTRASTGDQESRAGTLVPEEDALFLMKDLGEGVSSSSAPASSASAAAAAAAAAAADAAVAADRHRLAAAVEASVPQSHMPTASREVSGVSVAATDRPSGPSRMDAEECEALMKQFCMSRRTASHVRSWLVEGKPPPRSAAAAAAGGGSPPRSGQSSPRSSLPGSARTPLRQRLLQSPARSPGRESPRQLRQQHEGPRRPLAASAASAPSSATAPAAPDPLESAATPSFARALAVPTALESDSSAQDALAASPAPPPTPMASQEALARPSLPAPPPPPPPMMPPPPVAAPPSVPSLPALGSPPAPCG